MPPAPAICSARRRSRRGRRAGGRQVDHERQEGADQHQRALRGGRPSWATPASPPQARAPPARRPARAPASRRRPAATASTPYTHRLGVLERDHERGAERELRLHGGQQRPARAHPEPAQQQLNAPPRPPAASRTRLLLQRLPERQRTQASQCSGKNGPPFWAPIGRPASMLCGFQAGSSPDRQGLPGPRSRLRVEHVHGIRQYPGWTAAPGRRACRPSRGPGSRACRRPTGPCR